VLNQGNVLTTTANSLNFTGSGVSSSATGNSVTVDIYGASNFLPPQAGNIGNVLSTDGTNTLWQSMPGAFGLVIDGGNAVYVSPYIIDGGFAT
jgi:acetaldehyde dehydrogenase (acetylating)